MAKEKEKPKDITPKESTRNNLFDYNEESIKSLDWKEHIRLRPGMYIGKLGDGSSPDDGIYVLVKEVIDNCIDEYTMGYGKTVEITIDGKEVTIRDYGRGIPLGKVVDVVSKINTGAKYDSKVFQKSVGLNGVGTKAVNALSSYFKVKAVRDGKEKTAEFERGFLIKEYKEAKTGEDNGTVVTFIPDETVFKNFKFHPEFLENQIWNYCFLNAGLKLVFNGKTFVSKNGLLDLLQRKTNEDEIRYPIIPFFPFHFARSAFLVLRQLMDSYVNKYPAPLQKNLRQNFSCWVPLQQHLLNPILFLSGSQTPVPPRGPL